MKKLFILCLIIILVSCKNISENVDNGTTIDTTAIAVDSSSIISDNLKEIVEVKESTLKKFTYEEVARYAMATSMQEPVGIVKSQKRKNYYYVEYIRPSDSKKFEYKVKFKGNRVIWGDLNGRWQDTEYDEKISFAEKDNKLNIITTYSDDSKDLEEFNKGD